MGIASGVKAIVVRGYRALILRDPNGEIDLPGGRREEFESYEECLHREVVEETGLKIKIENLVAFWTFMKTPDLRIEGRTYICRCHGGRLKLSPEHSDYQWVSLSKLGQYVFKVPYLGSSEHDA